MTRWSPPHPSPRPSPPRRGERRVRWAGRRNPARNTTATSQINGTVRVPGRSPLTAGDWFPSGTSPVDELLPRPRSSGVVLWSAAASARNARAASARRQSGRGRGPRTPASPARRCSRRGRTRCAARPPAGHLGERQFNRASNWAGRVVASHWPRVLSGAGLSNTSRNGCGALRHRQVDAPPAVVEGARREPAGRTSPGSASRPRRAARRAPPRRPAAAPGTATATRSPGPFSRVSAVAVLLVRKAREVTISRTARFTDQPSCTNPVARKSSNSGCDGPSPRVAEVVRRPHQPAAVQPVPRPVDVHPDGQRVVVGRDLRRRARGGRRSEHHGSSGRRGPRGTRGAPPGRGSCGCRGRTAGRRGRRRRHPRRPPGRRHRRLQPAVFREQRGDGRQVRWCVREQPAADERVEQRRLLVGERAVSPRGRPPSRRRCSGRPSPSAVVGADPASTGTAGITSSFGVRSWSWTTARTTPTETAPVVRPSLRRPLRAGEVVVCGELEVGVGAPAVGGVEPHPPTGRRPAPLRVRVVRPEPGIVHDDAHPAAAVAGEPHAHRLPQPERRRREQPVVLRRQRVRVHPRGEDAEHDAVAGRVEGELAGLRRGGRKAQTPCFTHAA